jgi:hypothetical protein
MKELFEQFVKERIYLKGDTSGQLISTAMPGATSANIIHFPSLGKA